MIPILRREKYYKVIIDGEGEVLAPVTRIENFLARIAGSSYPVLTPVTREEMYLSAIVKDTSEIPEPMTRVEKFYAAIAGAEIEPPVPVTREECWLNDWLNAAPSTDKLPDGYKRIESLTMDNNCYYIIDDFYLHGSDILKFSASITNACNVIGAYGGTGGPNYSVYGTTSSGNYLRYYSDTYNSKFIANRRYDVTLTPTGSHGMENDSTWNEVTFTTSKPLCIGTTSPTISTTSKMRGTFYGNVEVEGPNGLRFNGIPCERLSDGEIGYYDTISKTFYEPVGETPTIGM